MLFAPSEYADEAKTRDHLRRMARKVDRGSLAPPAVSTLRDWGILGDNETCGCDIDYHGGRNKDTTPHFDAIEKATESDVQGGEGDEDTDDRLEYGRGDALPADIAPACYESFGDLVLDADGNVVYSPDEHDEDQVFRTLDMWDEGGFDPAEYESGG